mmetsp:Transcript_102871/g.297438  ORF Transcript_102871/g.297438 Transcript_102871/m.297438 type:complete len:172 (+) Transcript_102871:172-687(+)
MAPDVKKGKGAGKKPRKSGAGQGANRGGNANKAGNRRAVTKFEGKTDELKDHVYDFGNNKQEELFAKTTEEIAEFVGRTYPMGGDMKTAIEELTMPVLVKPQDPPSGATMTDKRIWDKEVKLHVRKKNILEEGNKNLYSLVGVSAPMRSVRSWSTRGAPTGQLRIGPMALG